MAVERVLSNLNLISFKTEGGLQNHIDELQDGDLVFTPDNSLKGNLFDFKWTDHKLNDISWLNADTFSWQPGDKYVAAYEHLANDINGKTLQSEAVDNITVQFYLTDDGHKICPASEENNLVALYEATGVAWYYLLDQTNQQFKLPRTKWGFTGLRDSVGGYVEPTLPNIKGGQSFSNVMGFPESLSDRGEALYTTSDTVSKYFNSSSSTASRVNGFAIDASRASAIYQDGATVQPPATQMHLYFWVGAFDQTATEQTAGLNAEMFNGKADRNLLNTTDNVDIVVESQLPTVDNGYTWYRKYKSGWVEQGGVLQQVGTSANVTITFPVEMANNQYSWNIGIGFNGTNQVTYIQAGAWNFTTTTMNMESYAQGKKSWQVSGMSAQ